MSMVHNNINTDLVTYLHGIYIQFMSLMNLQPSAEGLVDRSVDTGSHRNLGGPWADC